MCSMNERTNEMTKHTRVNLLLAYPLITSLPTHFSPILLVLPIGSFNFLLSVFCLILYFVHVSFLLSAPSPSHAKISSTVVYEDLDTS